MTIGFQNSSFINGGSVATSGTYSNGVSVSSFYNTDVLDNKYDYNETKESYEIAVEGKDAAIQDQINTLDYYIQNGEEDKVLDAYNDLLESMKSQTRYAKLVSEDGNDKQLRSVARQMIEGQIGCNLADYIENNTSDHSGTICKKILYWGNADSTSSEDLLKEICNIDKQKKSANILGCIGAAIGSIIAAPVNFLCGNVKH